MRLEQSFRSLMSSLDDTTHIFVYSAKINAHVFNMDIMPCNTPKRDLSSRMDVFIYYTKYRCGLETACVALNNSFFLFKIFYCDAAEEYGYL